MDRITGTAVIDLGGGKRGFQAQVLSTGAGSQEGTPVSDDWLNAVQEEIMNVITAAGLNPNSGDWTQLWQAIVVHITRAFSDNQSLAGNGWIRLPGGLIIQWLTISGVVDGTYSTADYEYVDLSASWPIAWPNGLLSFGATGDKTLTASAESNEMGYALIAHSATQFTVQVTRMAGTHSPTETVAARAFALGY
ncbi:MAG: hypothetical protein ABGW90_12090 [Martelella sp.]